jgi:hypothetical protein
MDSEVCQKAKDFFHLSEGTDAKGQTYYEILSSDQMTSNCGTICIGDRDPSLIDGCQTSGWRCRYGNKLRFRYKITIPTNPSRSAGVFGDSLDAFISFDQLGLQLMYFTEFAQIHLIALKELQLRNPQAIYAYRFYQRVKAYKDYIDYYGPIFRQCNCSNTHYRYCCCRILVDILVWKHL